MAAKAARHPPVMSPVPPGATNTAARRAVAPQSLRAIVAQRSVHVTVPVEAEPVFLSVNAQIDSLAAFDDAVAVARRFRRELSSSITDAV